MRSATWTKLNELVTQLRDEYQDRFDNMSERGQEGEAGERLLENIQHLEDALSALEEIE